MFKRVYAIAFLIVISFASCKKDKATSGNDTPTPTTNRAELTKDSIFLYAKQVYLWNDAIPEYSVVKPRDFKSSSNQLDNFNTLLFRLTQYKINPTTGRAYEFYDFNDDGRADEPKFSYIEDLVASGQIAIANPKKSSVDLNGEGNDTGLNFSYRGSETNYNIIISYVSPGSPAKLEGLNRGDTVLILNGVRYGSNFYGEINNIIDLLDANTITVSGKKRGTGVSFNFTLNKTKYNSTPILKDTIFTETGGKKIGYFAYARFSSQTNSIPALNAVFDKFNTAGVTDLIVDLRYNGGGFVSTAEHLVNLIVPAQHNGKRMFTEFFNATMRDKKAIILKNQPRRNQDGSIANGNYFDNADYSIANNTTNITKNGGLTDVNRVVFITGPGTASSSELVINSLKPYLGDNLKIVGEQSYGKPVGFFPIRIDKYDVYFSMFETQNSLGQGAYYDGFVPDRVVSDDVRRDFGDKAELNTAQAINFIKNGSFSSSNVASTKGASVSNSSLNSMKSLDTKDVFSREFKGMIDYPGRR
ncbi:S41 family peptidase [Pedobacter glucosidilyticus]|uniref:S41 family peptidase n=1 Tax=Pedobacter glucosidilyticus TaxID=1122941 RepID=UPI000566D4C0|nr:S41 family peptidase [Pedobacter glucosidilyticus]